MTPNTNESPKAAPFPGSLRDFFAGQALALGAQYFHDYTGHGGIHDIVTVAYEIADAMLAERDKEIDQA
uniref:Uncharacterized protein n=1 Tax=viral metagenome TaxID=1070528 RepID=A0A6M3LM21_9ZZZZ